VQSFISDGSFVKKLRLQDIRTDRLDKWRDGEIPIYGPKFLFVRDVIKFNPIIQSQLNSTYYSTCVDSNRINLWQVPEDPHILLLDN